MKGDCIEPYSAGAEAHGLNPYAVRVMAEAGVDISRQWSKRIEEVQSLPFDCVVTMCDAAVEHCPVFPRKVPAIHVGFDDPPQLARDARNEEQILDCYRRVRDEIRAFVDSLPDSISQAIRQKEPKP